ncbi:sigma-70 family RNA polymerase sigma factor [Pseudoroseomonas cervicalis]|uniref:sigma-70 family RNA polymerase sigma factor n=1 Tax=Teichococcus cervicalis TaxID=204525 RepID=UPI00278ACA95|nr:sigma-70 family RNA polymerase sigma factor [Pseudoroseomonas cervicalis]MDQ1079095.1 RNA polymerase sigma factor (sigma-70 family) [Pseudoroseomonas cervicalis]
MTISRREEDWAAWMRAARAGDAEAYRQFLLGVAPYLRALARRSCLRAGFPRDNAEDVVQDVLLAIHLKRHSWDQTRPIGPWLAAIARNRLIDAVRRRGGRPPDVSLELVAETLAAGDGEAADIRHDIGRLLAQLAPRQRQVVEAVSIEGRSAGEAAARLRMSEGAVRVTLHRALKLLAALHRKETA